MEVDKGTGSSRESVTATASPLPPIFVVVGSTGEYSDRGEWLTRAFRSEDAAKAYVEFLTAERQRLAPAGEYVDYDQREEIAGKMRAYDPRYSEDYTGTSWFVSAVELAEA
jgi:hypothetical protein